MSIVSTCGQGQWIQIGSLVQLQGLLHKLHQIQRHFLLFDDDHSFE